MIAIMCYYPLNMPLTSQNDSAKCLDLTLLDQRYWCGRYHLNLEEQPYIETC